MDLKNKLKNIPKVYYFNSDDNVNRKEYIETNLSNYKVSCYERVPLKFDKNNLSEWKDLILDKKNYKLSISTASYAIVVLEFLKNWYENTEEESLIISKDTIDFGTLEYLPFDWQEIMNRLPYDWDCLLLGFENLNYIPFYLHPIVPGHTFSIAMLNRRYVKKIIKLHCIDDKYNLTNKIANKKFGLKSGTVDYFIGHCGKTYCLPIFPNNLEFFDIKSKKYTLIKNNRIKYYEWWRFDSKKYNLDEIFLYGKPNDKGMIKKSILWS